MPTEGDVSAATARETLRGGVRHGSMGPGTSPASNSVSGDDGLGRSVGSRSQQHDLFGGGGASGAGTGVCGAGSRDVQQQPCNGAAGASSADVSSSPPMTPSGIWQHHAGGNSSTKALNGTSDPRSHLDILQSYAARPGEVKAPGLHGVSPRIVAACGRALAARMCLLYHISRFDSRV